MLEDGYKGICSHCGTVARALVKWSKQDTADCPCLCHIPPPVQEKPRRRRATKK